jgi:transcriptional regulator with XRE-family HTH domain
MRQHKSVVYSRSILFVLCRYLKTGYIVEMDIANRIRLGREAKGWTQPELAVRCGWGHNQGRISHYETGRRTPKASELADLENALGLTRGFLMGAESTSDPSEAELLAGFRTFTPESRRVILALVRSLVDEKS